MHGPSHASTSPRGDAICSSVASSTPPANPRQPACAAAISRPSTAQNSTGRQSAVRMDNTVPGTRDTAASATGSSALGNGPSSATSLPCTWRNQRGAAGSAKACCRALRLVATASVTSPLRRPRLKRSNGAADTPGPCRVVTAACTCGGAGQSGKIQDSVMTARSKNNLTSRALAA